MKQSKFGPDVYVALREYGMSNRAIARELGVSEAAVRRGLEGIVDRQTEASPRRRQYMVTVEEV